MALIPTSGKWQWGDYEWKKMIRDVGKILIAAVVLAAGGALESAWTDIDQRDIFPGVIEGVIGAGVAAVVVWLRRWGRDNRPVIEAAKAIK